MRPVPHRCPSFSRILPTRKPSTDPPAACAGSPPSPEPHRSAPITPPDSTTAARRSRKYPGDVMCGSGPCGAREAGSVGQAGETAAARGLWTASQRSVGPWVAERLVGQRALGLQARARRADVGAPREEMFPNTTLSLTPGFIEHEWGFTSIRRTSAAQVQRPTCRFWAPWTSMDRLPQVVSWRMFDEVAH